MEFEFKTKPFGHQEKEFTISHRMPVRGHLWEMGTGKSKVNVDTCASLYIDKEIDGALIVAPSGVHRNWVVNEFPTHLMDGVMRDTLMHSYSTEKAATRKHERACEDIVAHKGFSVLAMSYDAMTTKSGKAVAWEFLKHRKTIYIADEARRIKTPGADRTKAVIKSASYAKYRRLLNGTPVPNGPFDLYSQMLFLAPDFWKPLGISTFAAFKSYFGVFIKGFCGDGRGGTREFPQLVSYRNLDVLNKLLDVLCTRVLKEEVLTLPPKCYSRRAFTMTKEQSRIYDELSENFISFLDGEMVTAPLALTRLLRLQQITSGFVPLDLLDDSEEPIRDIPGDNPRMELLKEIVEDIPHKAIIWCRFKKTIKLVAQMLGDSCVQYHGDVGEDDRAAAIERFQKGDAKFFVANAQTAGEGLTLTAAKTCIYCENTYDLAARLQSEDRAHRIGQDQKVDYIDLVAAGTVDEHITTALQKKLDIADQITGDKIRRDLLIAA